MYWTREQRGEEAAGWLLFRHKSDYLRSSAARFGRGSARVFCVPRQAVDDSSPGERILLLLAAALIEAHAVTVAVTDEPEYAGMTGFVADRHRAIEASWIGADGIWSVDVTDHRYLVGEYLDAARHATAGSLVAAPDPRGRLRRLADYLGLDWAWLLTRCRDLAGHGCAGFAQPRSRHLSTAGIDNACRFLAGLDTPHG